jgi:hypothetical protein
MVSGGHFGKKDWCVAGVHQLQLAIAIGFAQHDGCE